MEARYGVYNQVFSKKLGCVLPDGWVADIRRQTAKFVLDDYPSQAVEDFGLDLIKDELFGLPFPSCYFEWMFEGNISSILAYEDDENRIMGWWAGKGCDGWGAGAPLRFQKSKLRDFLKEKGTVRGYTKESDIEWLSESAESLIEEIAACVALLACKGVEKETISQSASVNRKRERDGRDPLPSYTIIRLARYRKKHGGGTHASPVPHFRRGHIRTLQSSQRTIVRPAIIMADPGAMPTHKIGKHEP